MKSLAKRQRGEPYTVAKSRKSMDDAPPKAKSDAYTGLLILSLLAQLAGIGFLYLDWSQYPESKPPKVNDRPPAATAPANPPLDKQAK